MQCRKLFLIILISLIPQGDESLCETLGLWTSVDLVPFWRHPNSSIKEGGTAHSSNSNIGASSMCLVWPSVNQPEKNCLHVMHSIGTDFDSFHHHLHGLNRTAYTVIMVMKRFRQIRDEFGLHLFSNPQELFQH